LIPRRVSTKCTKLSSVVLEEPLPNPPRCGYGVHKSLLCSRLRQSRPLNPPSLRDFERFGSPPELGVWGAKCSILRLFRKCVYTVTASGREPDYSYFPHFGTSRGVILGTFANRFLPHRALRQRQVQRERLA